METSAPRKKSVPGVRDQILQIRALSDSIVATDAEIKAAQEKCRALLEEALGRTEKTRLLGETRVLSDEITALRQERKGFYDQLDDIRSRLDGLKEETTKTKSATAYRSAEEIERRMAALDYRLVAERITPADERAIAAEMLALRTRMNQIADLEASTQTQRALEETCRELKANIARLSKAITEKTAARDVLRTEIDRITAENKSKPPAVETLEKRIAELRAKRQESIQKKDAIREVIRALEEEHAQFEKLLEEQRALEDKKDRIRKTISELNEKKMAILGTLSEASPAIIDSVVFTLNSLRAVEPLRVGADLVSSLLKLRVSIPRTGADIDGVIAALQVRKDTGSAEYQARAEAVTKEVEQLNKRVQAEHARLAELPETDVKILQRGRRDTFKNKN